jgi:hypothetical protein
LIEKGIEKHLAFYPERKHVLCQPYRIISCIPMLLGVEEPLSAGDGVGPLFIDHGLIIFNVNSKVSTGFRAVLYEEHC